MLNKGICLKILGRSANGYLGLFLINGNKVRLSGNIPYFPNGFSVSLSTNDRFIEDYDVDFTSRNLTILGDTEEEFRKKLGVHKLTNCLWEKINLEDPYSAEPFEKADKVFSYLGGKATDRKRLNSLFAEVRDTFRKKRMEDYTLDEYVNGVRDVEESGSFDYLPQECLVAELNGRFFCLSPDCKYVKDRELLKATQYINDYMSIADSNNFRFKDEKMLDDFNYSHSELSDEQKEAVSTLTDYRPVVVTGYAGTGKTTVIKSIIEASRLSDDDILLLAPTGKASRRMSESTGKTAKTIHSALRKTPEDDFTYYNEHRRFPQKLIIVDESSMIDTLLMYDLLKAISPSSKLFFIGDYHQLAPVSCGEPFFEFINKEMCKVVRLTHIYRQNEGTILRNSQHVLNNEELEKGDDFIIRNISRDEIGDYVGSCQIISPYNELNDYINSLIQERNTSPFIEGTRLKVGDKVIGTINTDNFCNGDIGKVISANETEVNILFDGNAETKAVKKADIKNGDIVLAYAITVHKMQGSECESVKIFLPIKKSPFITQSLVYTAITRAKKKVGLYYYS